MIRVRTRGRIERCNSDPALLKITVVNCRLEIPLILTFQANFIKSLLQPFLKYSSET